MDQKQSRSISQRKDSQPDLVVILRPESMSFPSVTRNLRSAKFGTSMSSIVVTEPGPELDDEMGLPSSP
jgi:hypothetical protein